MIGTAFDIRADEGSVVVFEVERDDGPNVLIGVDHGMAQMIADEMPCDVEFEAWQVLGIVQ